MDRIVLRASLFALGLSVCALVFMSGCTDQNAAPVAKDAGVEGLEKTVEKGPVKLTVRVTPKSPSVADTIVLELIVRSDPGVEIKKPEFGRGVHEFNIYDFSVLPEKLEGGKIVRRYRYKLETFAAGRLLIRSQQIEYFDKRAPDSKSLTVPPTTPATTPGAEPAKRTFILSAPIEVEVTSKSGSDLNSLVKAEDPKPLATRPLPAWAIALIVAGVLGGAGAALYFVFRKRAAKKAAEIVRTPEEIARDELDALLKERLAEREEFKEFYVRLTGIVRRYIERKTGIHAPEQTTEEFLRDPDMRRTFSLDQAQRFAQFLEAADMVKYAAMRPGARELEESVDRAREFIGMTQTPAAAPALAVR